MKHAYDLGGTVVFITGAAGGIGREAALAVAGCGAAVVLADLDEERLSAVEAEIRDAGGSAASKRVDIREPGDCAALAAFAVQRFGRLDGALCVAGKIGRETILTATVEAWRSVIDVNLTGTFLTVQAAAREMIACGNGGSIVTYSSGIVLHCPPRGVEYSASKTAILALTKSSAGELGPHGIRVNAIAPGVIRTAMSRAESWPLIAQAAPLGRVGEPADLTGPACFFLSSDAGYVTGHTMYVNGGHYMA